MIHDEVDIERWIELFPLERLRKEGRDFVLARQKESPSNYPTKKALEDHIALMQPGGEQITGPFHIAVVEQIRREIFRSKTSADKVPTDVFVFSKGEPPRRDITKVGGLPYWPAKNPWPHRKQKRLTFIAQFLFVDSSVGSLPGDVLLIFGNSIHMDPALLHFEWVTCADTELISAAEIPKPEFDLPPCYGSIFRTFDYPESDELFQSFKAPWCLDVIEGTKIGGVPRWIQGEEIIPGRFLCALGSIFPHGRHPFPYLNQPSPMDLNSVLSNPGLMWGDVGSLYVFIDQWEKIHSVIQCY
jgi:hypothetical protein